MIRKFIALFLLITSSAVLLAAMDQAFINKLKQDRYFDHLNAGAARDQSIYHRFLIRSDRWRYGDIYGMCYLKDYKFQLDPFKKYEKSGPGPATGRNLYIIGDSYLADKSLSGAFDDVENIYFLDRRFPFGPIVLDSTRQNLLIMEFAERNLVDYDIKNTAENRWTGKDVAGGLNHSTAASNCAGECQRSGRYW